MTSFPRLLGLSRVIKNLRGTKNFHTRSFLLGSRFSRYYNEGDYVVTDDWDGSPDGVLQVVEMDRYINGVQLEGERSARAWYCRDGFLKVPEEYLVWSSGEDNKTVPLNCESLSIEGLKEPMLEQEGLCQEIPLPIAPSSCPALSLPEDVEYVTCTNNTGVGEDLTIGEEYKVVGRYVRPTGSEFITIIDDYGLEKECCASRFVAKEDKGKDRFNFNFNIKGASAESFRSATLEVRERMRSGSVKPDGGVKSISSNGYIRTDSQTDVPYYITSTRNSYVICPATGRKLDPNTLLPIEESVDFTNRSVL